MFIAYDLPMFDELSEEFFDAMYREYRRSGLWDITTENTDFVVSYYAG